MIPVLWTWIIIVSWFLPPLLHLPSTDRYMWKAKGLLTFPSKKLPLFRFAEQYRWQTAWSLPPPIIVTSNQETRRLDPVLGQCWTSVGRRRSNIAPTRGQRLLSDGMQSSRWEDHQSKWHPVWDTSRLSPTHRLCTAEWQGPILDPGRLEKGRQPLKCINHLYNLCPLNKKICRNSVDWQMFWFKLNVCIYR